MVVYSSSAVVYYYGMCAKKWTLSRFRSFEWIRQHRRRLTCKNEYHVIIHYPSQRAQMSLTILVHLTEAQTSDHPRLRTL